jgi:dipeptide transport system ATP-binding protein
VDKGEVLAIVGESGSGKSVTMMALMGLIEHPGIVTADSLSFDGKNMLKLSNRQRRQIVGKDLSMVFQDPMTALNPSYTVGFQIEEVLRLHLKMSGKPLRKRATELLEKVEIPGAASRMDAYPHQLSGGMSQRVAIAMAIAGEPKLLIADEPTTALDVTIQAQIMDLLLALQKEQNMGLVLITHDLAVVAETAQRVCVMYAGQAVEVGQVPGNCSTFRAPVQRSAAPRFPSTAWAPRACRRCRASSPAVTTARSGCLLSPRCPYVQDNCRSSVQPWTRKATASPAASTR